MGRQSNYPVEICIVQDRCASDLRLDQCTEFPWCKAGQLSLISLHKAANASMEPESLLKTARGARWIPICSTAERVGMQVLRKTPPGPVP